MTEPVLIRRKKLVSNGGLGQQEAGPELDSGIKLMVEVVARKGTRDQNGFRLYDLPRFTMTGYAPSDLELIVGDVVEYRGKTYGILGPSSRSSDRRKITIDVEQLKQ